PVDDDVGAATGDHLRRGDVRSSRPDLDVQILLRVESLVLSHVVTGELRLGHPFELERQGVRGNSLGTGERESAREHQSQRSFHFLLPVYPPRTEGCQNVTTRSTSATTP